MKTILKAFVGLLVLLATLSSCQDSFLETAPRDRGSVDAFFETEEDVLRAINGIYDVFQGTVWGGAFYMMHPHMDIMTDNAVGCCPWEYQYLTIARGQHNPSTGGIINLKWDFGYEGIFRANSVLENIDEVQMEASDREALRAEVRFLRALMYADMTSFFGDLPIVDKVITREEGLAIRRNPKAEVLNFIFADLDFAEATLGLTPFRGNLGRPTRQAAIALKSRVKLYNQDWAGAAAEARKVVNLSEANPSIIGLYPVYEQVFSPTNENNREVLFDIQYAEGTQGEGNFIQVMLAPGPEGNPGSGWGSITPLDGLVNAFKMTDGLPISQSPLFDPANPYLNRDERLYANLFIPGVSLWRGQVYNEALSGFSPYFAVRKWVDLNATIGEDACACNETNMILLRYAEVLLNLAEAVNEQTGPTAEVYTAVNAIRRRANMPDFPAGLSQEAMRELIRQERHVEFPWEGLRYHDLLRWRIADTTIPRATLFGESRDTRIFDPSKHYLWPIPQKEIDLNPNLSQNPGW